MRLENKDLIRQPIDVVYKLVRDDLAKLVPYMPSIDRIEVVEKQALDGDQLRIVNRWYAKADIPGVLQSFVKPDLFSWKDTALWKNAETKVEYKLESFVANNLFEARGVNSFREVEPGVTELNVSCDIDLHPENVPGVPKLLVRKFVPVVESIITKMLQPNLTSLATGLNAYFAQQK